MSDPTDGLTALEYAVLGAAKAPPGAAAVARTLALLEAATLGCSRAEHAAKLSVGAVVTWTSSLCPSFPTEREGTVVEIWSGWPKTLKPIVVEGASGAKGAWCAHHLRLREGA